MLYTQSNFRSSNGSRGVAVHEKSTESERVTMKAVGGHFRRCPAQAPMLMHTVTIVLDRCLVLYCIVQSLSFDITNATQSLYAGTKGQTGYQSTWCKPEMLTPRRAQRACPESRAQLQSHTLQHASCLSGVISIIQSRSTRV